VQFDRFFFALILIVAAFGIFIYIKLGELKLLTERAEIGIQAGVDDINAADEYERNLNDTYKHFLGIIIILPIIFGILLFARIRRNLSHKEKKILSELSNATNLIDELNKICLRLISDESLDKIEFRDNKKRISVFPLELNNELSTREIICEDMLKINNMLSEIVKGKYKQKLFLDFREDKIILLKRR